MAHVFFVSFQNENWLPPQHDNNSRIDTHLDVGKYHVSLTTLLLGTLAGLTGPKSISMTRDTGLSRGSGMSLTADASFSIAVTNDVF